MPPPRCVVLAACVVCAASVLIELENAVEPDVPENYEGEDDIGPNDDVKLTKGAKEDDFEYDPIGTDYKEKEKFKDEETAKKKPVSAIDGKGDKPDPTIMKDEVIEALTAAIEGDDPEKLQWEIRDAQKMGMKDDDLMSKAFDRLHDMTVAREQKSKEETEYKMEIIKKKKMAHVKDWEKDPIGDDGALKADNDEYLYQHKDEVERMEDFYEPVDRVTGVKKGNKQSMDWQNDLHRQKGLEEGREFVSPEIMKKMSTKEHIMLAKNVYFNWWPGNYPHPDENSDGPIVHVTYDRTGTHFVEKLIGNTAPVYGWEAKVYQNDTGASHAHGRSKGSFWEEDIPSKNHTSILVRSPSVTWNPPENYRMIFFYRNPFNMILDAYLHWRRPLGVQKWMAETSTSLRTDEAAHEEIFKFCDYKCSLRDIFISEKETVGLNVTGLLLRNTIHTMLENMKKYANDPQVMFVSLDQLIWKGGLEKTTNCYARFLGKWCKKCSFNDHGVPIAKVLRKLNLDNRHVIRRNRHTTADLKADKKRLWKALDSHPVWHQHWTQVQRVMRVISERQRIEYQCPVVYEY